MKVIIIISKLFIISFLIIMCMATVWQTGYEKGHRDGIVATCITYDDKACPAFVNYFLKRYPNEK